MAWNNETPLFFQPIGPIDKELKATKILFLCRRETLITHFTEIPQVDE